MIAANIHTRSLRRYAGQGGFTLIELMVALIVSAIVVMGVFAFSAIQQSTASMHQRNVRVQQALEGAMWTMAADVRHAGLGFARICSELRVYDPGSGRLVDPGGAADPSQALLDPVTGEAYWVLRDGLQAHWNSTGANDLVGGAASSAFAASAADSFDVIVADPAYLNTIGAFELAAPIAAGDVMVTIRTSALLNNGNPQHLEQMQHLFVPGTFFVVTRPTPNALTNPFRADRLGQCVLLQITGELLPNAGDPQQWDVPIGATSGFNNLQALLADNNGVIDETPACAIEVQRCDDWDPAADIVIGSNVVPLGRLRWSRYEIDYTIPAMPYLVRSDILGVRQGDQPLPVQGNYALCPGQACPMPQLHLPSQGGGPQPPAVAIGPMIEDMQVAVGCDGWTVNGAANAPMGAVPPPDPGFEEAGPTQGPSAGLPNSLIDENPSGDRRDADEWLGNARNEQWAPDCVWFGTAEYARDQWAGLEGANQPPPFRMSPQTIRITLVASSELAEEGGGLATTMIQPIEDRVELPSPVGVRQRFTVTERFSPANLRWRDPSIP